MKRFLQISGLAFLILFYGAMPFVISGCANPPAEKTVEFQTLKTVGLTAKAGMDATTLLLKQGKITVAQWRTVAGYYDLKFQPVYSLAINAAQSDLSTIASPDVLRLASEFASLVGALTSK